MGDERPSGEQLDGSFIIDLGHDEPIYGPPPKGELERPEPADDED